MSYVAIVVTVAKRITFGQDESLAKDNSFGYVRLVPMLTTEINSATIANRFILITLTTQYPTEKNGCNAKTVKGGITQSVNLKTAVEVLI